MFQSARFYPDVDKASAAIRLETEPFHAVAYGPVQQVCFTDRAFEHVITQANALADVELECEYSHVVVLEYSNSVVGVFDKPAIGEAVRRLITPLTPHSPLVGTGASMKIKLYVLEEDDKWVEPLRPARLRFRPGVVHPAVTTALQNGLTYFTCNDKLRLSAQGFVLHDWLHAVCSDMRDILYEEQVVHLSKNSCVCILPENRLVCDLKLSGCAHNKFAPELRIGSHVIGVFQSSENGTCTQALSVVITTDNPLPIPRSWQGQSVTVVYDCTCPMTLSMKTAAIPQDVLDVCENSFLRIAYDVNTGEERQGVLMFNPVRLVHSVASCKW